MLRATFAADCLDKDGTIEARLDRQREAIALLVDLVVRLWRRADAAEERMQEMIAALRKVHDELDGAEQALDALAKHQGEHENDLAGLKERTATHAQRLRAFLPSYTEDTFERSADHS